MAEPLSPPYASAGDMQCIGFEASFLDDAYVPDDTSILEQAASLLGELLLHPATKNGRLRQDYVLSERKNLIQMIRSSRNDKRQYAQDRLIEEMFAGEEYAVGRFGTVEQAEKINVTKLFAQYQTLLEQSPIELFYCGSAPAKRVELAWREALMGLPRSGERYLVETDAKRPPERDERQFQEQMDVSQGKMELGFRIGFGLGDPMYPAMLVANAMFGGTTTSRLFLHVQGKTVPLLLCQLHSGEPEGTGVGGLRCGPGQFQRCKERNPGSVGPAEAGGVYHRGIYGRPQQCGQFPPLRPGRTGQNVLLLAAGPGCGRTL